MQGATLNENERLECRKNLSISGGSAVVVDLAAQKALPETRLGSRGHGRSGS
jgi:hypothetical protein